MGYQITYDRGYVCKRKIRISTKRIKWYAVGAIFVILVLIFKTPLFSFYHLYIFKSAKPYNRLSAVDWLCSDFRYISKGQRH